MQAWRTIAGKKGRVTNLHLQNSRGNLVQTSRLNRPLAFHICTHNVSETTTLSYAGIEGLIQEANMHWQHHKPLDRRYTKLAIYNSLANWCTPLWSCVSLVVYKKDVDNITVVVAMQMRATSKQEQVSCIECFWEHQL